MQVERFSLSLLNPHYRYRKRIIRRVVSRVFETNDADKRLPLQIPPRARGLESLPPRRQTVAMTVTQ